MDSIAGGVSTILTQFQKPTLAFLVGGMVLAALGSRLAIPDAVYKFIVVVLLLKVGMGAGISVRETEVSELLAPALGAAVLGVAIVALGTLALARRPGVSHMDGVATAGLFGAVSASTLAAGMAMLDEEGIAYEGFIGALYPFMDIAALVTAIVLARLNAERRTADVVQGDGTAVLSGGGTASGAGLLASGGARPFMSVDWSAIRSILVDTARSSAISALLLGLAIGALAKPGDVFDSFYNQLFYGLLSLLMLTMGMDAWRRLSELRTVAHIYLVYGILAPIVHGLLGLGVGLLVHQLTGFSQGGVILLAVLAASSSDISGPPTLRAALPKANPSAYVGTSTGLGTPIAILAIPLWIYLAEALVTR